MANYDISLDTPGTPTGAYEFPYWTGTKWGCTSLTTLTSLIYPVLLGRVTANRTNNTSTLAGLTDMTLTLPVGNYVGRMVMKCNNSTATEGIKYDFNGGTAVVSAFWSSANILIGGASVLGTLIGTLLSSVLNITTITGETVVVTEMSMVVSTAGTIIPRFAENTSLLGTSTVELGSYFRLEPSPN